MATDTPARPKGLGMASLSLGFLGLAFFWWVPFGIVLALAGLVIGFVGWLMARRGASNMNLLLGGMAISLVALVLDLVIASQQGLETFRFTALR